MILSNHGPELPAIVEGPGLAGVVDHVITSAATGYEKPHPGAFPPALGAAGRSSEIWMIGDNWFTATDKVMRKRTAQRQPGYRSPVPGMLRMEIVVTGI